MDAMSYCFEVEPFSVYDDIEKWRVGGVRHVCAKNTFKKANNKRLPTLDLPGFAKYAELAGGAAEFQKLALEGGEYKWLEAFAAVEARRMGALPSLTFPATRPTDVGYGDVFDGRKRPFDVKTVAPFGSFSVTETIEDRLFGKPGYSGLDGKNYPAVLILDVSFVDASALAKMHADLKAVFSGSSKSGRKGQSWRVIEIQVDYENKGYATYDRKPHKNPH
jgi:hypothetical protein